MRQIGQQSILSTSAQQKCTCASFVQVPLSCLQQTLQPELLCSCSSMHFSGIAIVCQTAGLNGKLSGKRAWFARVQVTLNIASRVFDDFRFISSWKLAPQGVLTCCRSNLQSHTAQQCSCPALQLQKGTCNLINRHDMYVSQEDV